MLILGHSDYVIKHFSAIQVGNSCKPFVDSIQSTFSFVNL